MSTVMIAVLTLLGGAVIGYLVLLSEFRRERRLQAYADFTGAFIAAGHAGAALHSLYISLGDTIWTADHKRDVEPWWNGWADAASALETAAARLNLVGSEAMRAKANDLDDFITANVRRVPPAYRTESAKEWGEAAQVGPAKTDSETVRLAREFADAARQEITRWFARAKRS